MKVLWLSNRVFSDRDGGGTGTWLQAMAQYLMEAGGVELGNISQGPVRDMLRQDHGQIQQWIVPAKRWSTHDVLPKGKIMGEIVDAVKAFSPDLVHVWGTERYWGLLTARGIIPGPALLEMQGLKFIWARAFLGNLSLGTRLRCIGLKECLRGTSLRRSQRRFERWGLAEREMIRQHRYISVPSPWMDAHVKAINSGARTFPADLALREPFYHARKWEPSGHMRVFCSSANPVPYKGLHVAVRAVALLRKSLPDVELRIAGNHRTSGLCRDGYISWLVREIKRLGLQESVVWLGPLDADQIVTELLSSAVMVVPPFVESYCLALCEAMMLGVPTVVSFTGGTVYLGRDEESTLFFAPGDVEMCAYQLARVLTDQRLAGRLSEGAREATFVRNDRSRLVRRQLDIYRSVAAGV